MKTFLLLICFIGIIGLLIYVGSLIINYDDKRQNRPQKPIDNLFNIIRWLLYIPVGFCSGIIFNIAVAFLLSDAHGWFISGTIMQLVFKILSLFIIGFCFYVIIPVLNKTKKIQSAAITVLIIGVLSFFAMLLNDGGITKSFVLDTISILIVIATSIYVIVKPESFEQ